MQTSDALTPVGVEVWVVDNDDDGERRLIALYTDRTGRLCDDDGRPLSSYRLPEHDDCPT